MLEKMKYLVIDLPEDIQKAKDFGDFQRCERLIQKYLKDEHTASFMKERLYIEQEILRRLPMEYPYTEEKALSLIQKEIEDFTMDELRHYEDIGGADWIYINGEVHLQERFFACLKKVYPEISERTGTPFEDNAFLNANMEEMKKYGKARWHICVHHTLRIHDDVFHEGKVLVHLPIPAKCANMEHINVFSFSKGGICDDPSSLSRTIAFEEDMHENHVFYVDYEYDCVAEYHDVFEKEGHFSDKYKEYTQEQYPQIVFTPQLRMLCDTLKGNETDPVKIAWNFYRYCTENVTYSYMRFYLSLDNIPSYAMNQRIGDCGVKALLFITLCRCAGIPAHWQSGLYANEGSIGNHDWAMFYIEPYGWLFADPSFGGSAYRIGNLERQKFYFGNLDPFRMAANNEFMQEFFIPKTQWRNDPYDNQSGEAEYVNERGLTTRDFDHKKQIILMKKIENQ